MHIVSWTLHWYSKQKCSTFRFDIIWRLYLQGFTAKIKDEIIQYVGCGHLSVWWVSAYYSLSERSHYISVVRFVRFIYMLFCILQVLSNQGYPSPTLNSWSLAWWFAWLNTPNSTHQLISRFMGLSERRNHQSVLVSIIKWISSSSRSFKIIVHEGGSKWNYPPVMVWRHCKKLTLAGGRGAIHLQPLTQPTCKNLAPHQGEPRVTAITDNIT